MTTPDTSDFRHLTEIEELRRALTNTQTQLAKAKRRNDQLVQATLQGAYDAMLALGPLPTTKRAGYKSGAGKPEVALWHLTDWQGSKVTTTYNSQIMRQRILQYCDKAARLTDLHRAHHPVNKCVILFGGDMGEGLFQFPQQPFEIDATLFQQYAQIARLEVEVVRRALTIYDEVEVIAEWGNHGRVGAKRATVPLSDNFDRMGYEFARTLLAESSDASRVKWEDCPEDIQHVEIGAYRALLIHGDEIGRNGFASKNTIINHVGRWQSGAHDWEFRDCYHGHYHTHSEDSLPNGYGTVFATGSPESDSRYASVSVAAGSRPSQRLHFIHPTKGFVTAQYRVWLT